MGGRSTGTTDPVFDREPLVVGTHRKKVSVRGIASASFAWIMETVAAGADAATITLYPSEVRADDRRLDDTDPSTNPFWIVDAAAVFASNPGNVVEGQRITLAECPWPTILVEVVVTADLPKFSFVVSMQGG